jgi:peptide/nickel transport system ATP-binding protein
MNQSVTPAGGPPILEADNVSKVYRLQRTRLFAPREELHAVKDVTLTLHRGGAIGIVGESGSGKSTLTRMLVGEERPTAGEVRFNGVDIWDRHDDGVRRDLRRRVQIVMQNPRMSMDPRMTIGSSLAEPLRSLKIEGDHERRILKVLDQVGMNRASLDKYPHQFSGGQMQRIAIARALLPSPDVLIADEPVSALDVSIQAQVLNLIKSLVRNLGLGLVIIAHDLAVVSYVTSRVLVMSKGRVVEAAAPSDLFFRPQAEETRALVDAVLTVEGGLKGKALA